MSRAMLARTSDTAASSSTRVSSFASGLKISQPGDAMEREADRVADAVASGNKIPGWSFANVAPAQVQRQPTPPPPTGQPAPQPNNYKEGAEKLGEAFLKTDVGKKLTDAASQDPVVKGVTDFVGTLPGKIIVGAAATATVAGLAAEHKALPVQIPEIPLDKVRPGLKVKITYEGPVDRPTKGMITFSYTPGGDQKKKGPTESDRIRSDTARLQAEQEEIRAHTTYAPGSQQDLDQKSMDRAVQDVTSRRFGSLPGTPGGPPLVPAPGLQQQQPDTGLRLPQYQSPFAPKTPHLLDKQLELKPLTSEPAAADAKKKEEKPVQRKAATHPDSLANPATVDATLRSSGLPLDSETRSAMESRFGVDFSRVRVHTDANAAASARGVDALAYTVGSDVVFGAGQYAPHTREGRRLLAHELTHVVQQSAPPAVQARSSRGGSIRGAKSKTRPTERANGAEIVAPPIARRASRRVQRKVKMVHDPNPTYSGFARLQELLDRLNAISQTLTFSMQGNELKYAQRSSAKMSNFDTQMKGFIDQDPVIPMKLTNRHGRLGDAEHGFHTQITIDNYASGYVDIDDLLASDDLGLQEALVHVLAERTATTNYAGRLGSPSLAQDTPLKRDQFLAAHEAGIDAEVELMKDFFGDDTIQADPGPNPGDDFHNFVNKDNDHIYARLQQGTGNQSGVQSVHIEVVTADGKNLTPEQFRALVKSRKPGGSGGGTPVHPKAAGSTPAVADANSIGEGLRSPSHPLDGPTQRDMELRFGFDFSEVRVHNGTRAAASAHSVNALAYTVGSDLVFADGQYAPHSVEGRRLLAHELTHVVQDNPGRRARRLHSDVTSPRTSAVDSNDVTRRTPKAGATPDISRPIPMPQAEASLHDAESRRDAHVLADEPRFRVPTAADLKALFTSGNVPKSVLKDRIEMALNRMAAEKRLKSTDPVPEIMKKIFPAAGGFDEAAYAAAVDVGDRSEIYQSVLDAEAQVTAGDKPKLTKVMEDSAKLIGDCAADAADLQSVFGAQKDVAKGVYDKAAPALRNAITNIDTNVTTDYNLDDPETGLGGWAVFATQHVHFRAAITKVTDVTAAKITIIHESCHLADGSVKDKGYYGSPGFESKPDDVKATNAAHYEEIPRRKLGKSKYLDPKGPADGKEHFIDFKPGTSASGAPESFDEKAKEIAVEAFRKGWDKALDIDLFLRNIRKDELAGNKASFTAHKPRILEISKLMHLTVHEQPDATASINDVDMVMVEGVVRAMGKMGKLAATQTVPNPVQLKTPPLKIGYQAPQPQIMTQQLQLKPMPGLSAPAGPPVLQTEDQAATSVILDTLSAFGNLTGSLIDDKALLDWLDSEYKKPL